MYNYMLTEKLAVDTPQTNRQETQKCRRSKKLSCRDSFPSSKLNWIKEFKI